MTAAARTKAERCFALARSTTFDGERDSAVARGIAIAEKAGLSLDLFDIAGRARAKAPEPPPSRFTDDLFRPSKAPEHYTAEEVSDVMRRFRESMDEALRKAGAGPDEDLYSARRRRFDEEVAAARQRDAFHEATRRATESIKRQAEELARRQREAAERRRERERSSYTALADKVANALWSQGWRAYRDADGEDGRRRWHVTSPTGATFENVSDERLCGIGMEHGAIDVIAKELRQRAGAGPSYAPFHEYGTRRS